MIKIVTAFFDIGRGDFEILARSTHKYFEYFKFWARLRNDLTIYCHSSHAKAIAAIRKGYGLEDKTHIKIIDDFTSIEASVYSKMQAIEKKESFKNFRYYDLALSNQADYNYVTYMKAWCLQDSAGKEEPDTMMAWLDFGYNHGGEKYINSLDFDFEWNYEFSDNINIFCLSNPEEISAMDTLQFQADCFIGHTVVMPAKLCGTYWNLVRQSMSALIALDCMDDDQQLGLMAYKLRPELFSVKICGWFEDFLLCSCQNFTTTEKMPVKLTFKQRFYHWHHHLKPRNTFMKRTKIRKKRYVKRT